MNFPARCFMSTSNAKANLKVFGIVGLILLLFCCPVSAADDDPLSLEMTGQLVTKTVEDDTVTEHLTDLPEAVQTGDIVAYHITGQNITDRKLQRIEVGGKVPEGTDFIEDSATSDVDAVFKVSIDNGETYETPPVKRTVTTADGGQEIRIVPPKEYTDVRFVIKTLAPAQAFQCSYRVLVQ